jgi:AraC family transcriptional regulator
MRGMPQRFERHNPSTRWDEEIDLSALSSVDPHQMGADQTIFHLISSMVREVTAGCPAGAVFAESLSIALACYLLRRLTDRDKSGRPCEHGLSTQKLRLLKDFIESNLSRDIRLSDLCEIVQLGPRHLSRSFKDATGTTPHRFILHGRIIRAQDLLASGASATDTALQLGFASPSHFSDAFKKITGVSPRQYLRSK